MTKTIAHTVCYMLMWCFLSNCVLQDWGYIHSQLTLSKDSLDHMTLIKRMEFMSDRKFPWQNMDVDLLNRVNVTVHKYPYEHVERVNMAAAAMYKWVRILIYMCTAVIQTN